VKRPLSEKVLSPVGVLAVSVTVWILCLLSPFNTYTIEQSTEAQLLLLGFLGAFVAGTLVWRKKSYEIPIRRFESPRAQRVAFSLILFVAVIGLGLRFYDLLFVKHFAEYESVAAFRLAEVDSGPQSPGAISAISVLLFPVSLVAFTLSLYLQRTLFVWQRIAAALVLGGFLVYLFAQGGRTLLVTGGILCAATVLMRGFIDPTKRIDNRRFVVFGMALAVAFAGFVGYSAHVLQSRLDNMGVSDPHAFLNVVEEDRGYRIQEPYRSLIGSPEPGVSTAVLTASSLTYYINHGFFDFSELYESEKGNAPLGGVMQFAPVVRFVKSIGVDTPSVDEGMARIPRLGLFYTFFGNILIDFGVWGGFVYCFLFGAFTQALWLKAKAGSLLSLMLYPFFVSVIFHFPMMDMVSGGYGLFVAFDILAVVGTIEFFRLVYRARRRRTVELRAA
jgi:hypothetical protein